MSELKKLIEESNKAGVLLDQDIKELDEMQISMVKKREKVADADLKKLSQNRVDEIKAVDKRVQNEIERIKNLEDTLAKKSDENLTPEQKKEMSNILKELKGELNSF